jgi:TRAP-type C4-dicarboxylate transport system permease small subunit
MWGVLAWLDRNLEKSVIIAAYSTCAGIIAVEVFRRYVLSIQAPWSTTVPAYMFLWLTWIGAAHGAKIRAHLNFSEVRVRLPRRVQFVLMQIDNALFLILASIVIYYGFGLLQLQIDNQSVVPGTDTIPQWWFYSATPVGWLLLVIRVLQNVVKDCIAMRDGTPLDLGGGLAAAN